MVPAEFLKKFEADSPDGERELTRRSLGALIRSTHESFLKYRKPETLGPQARTHRAGRNDPCPCGSGKKYKRCCIDGAAA